MKYDSQLVRTVFLFLTSCSPTLVVDDVASDAGVPVDSGGPRMSETDAGPDAGADAGIDATVPTQPVELVEVPDAEYIECTTIGDASSGATTCGVRLTSGTCGKVSSSPVIAGNMLVLPQHADTGCGDATHHADLLGYDLTTDRLYALASQEIGGVAAPGFPTEGTPQVVGDRLYWPHLGASPLSVLDTRTWEQVPDFASNDSPGNVGSIGMGMDSSGVIVDVGEEQLFYFGTYNAPVGRGECNANPDYLDNPPYASGADPNCGSIFAIASDGAIRHRMGIGSEVEGELPYRSWVAAGITTNGSSIYVGGSPSHYGTESDIDGDTNGDGTPEVVGACAVAKMDLELRSIEALADPEEPGCLNETVEPHEDAVAGEPVIASDGTVWVQFTGPVHRDSSGQLQNMVLHYGAGLEPLCSRDIAYEDVASVAGDFNYTGAAYYQGPTVDEEGRVYVMFQNRADRTTTLYRLSEPTSGTECTMSPIFTTNGQATHSPTLVADDSGRDYVLVAISNTLFVIDRTSLAVELEIPLAGDQQVTATPVVHDGRIFVVDKHGTLSAITATIDGHAIVDYGNAYWPRYRRDNAGTASTAP